MCIHSVRWECYWTCDIHVGVAVWSRDVRVGVAMWSCDLLIYSSGYSESYSAGKLVPKNKESVK